MLRQFSVKLCHKQKPTFFFATFSAGNKFTFTFTIFTYQAVDAPISNFVIFLTQDIVKLLLKSNSYDILGRGIFYKELFCPFLCVLKPLEAF